MIQSPINGLLVLDAAVRRLDNHPDSTLATATNIYGATRGMVDPTPGTGQVYMTTKRDANGDMLRADRNYKLHVLADMPVGQFWSFPALRTFTAVLWQKLHGSRFRGGGLKRRHWLEK